MPFDTYHRNDQPDPIRVAAGGQVPWSSPRRQRAVLLLDPGDLEACDGSIDRLVEAIERPPPLGLTWPLDESQKSRSKRIRDHPGSAPIRSALVRVRPDSFAAHRDGHGVHAGADQRGLSGPR